MSHNGNTAAGKKTVTASGISFDSILDETCERLLDRQVQYSLQRIHELEEQLAELERELDDFLQSGGR